VQPPVSLRASTGLSDNRVSGQAVANDKTSSMAVNGAQTSPTKSHFTPSSSAFSRNRVNNSNIPNNQAETTPRPKSMFLQTTPRPSDGQRKETNLTAGLSAQRSNSSGRPISHVKAPSEIIASPSPLAFSFSEDVTSKNHGRAPPRRRRTSISDLVSLYETRSVSTFEPKSPTIAKLADPATQNQTNVVVNDIPVRSKRMSTIITQKDQPSRPTHLQLPLKSEFSSEDQVEAVSSPNPRTPTTSSTPEASYPGVSRLIEQWQRKAEESGVVNGRAGGEVVAARDGRLRGGGGKFRNDRS